MAGDPVAHSKSPWIHKFWLGKLGFDADYRAVRVPAGGLGDYLAARRRDPAWRGCNLTMPLKVEGFAAADRRTREAEGTGAVNCIAPGPEGLTGGNSDVAGVKAVLGSGGRTEAVCIIGAGGAARAAAYAFRDDKLRIVARDPAKARASLGAITPAIAFYGEAEAEAAFAGAQAVIQASSAGMAAAEPLSPRVLEALAALSPDCRALEMVYAPLRTPFLQRVDELGHAWRDGLDMLVAQAREAFRLFFGTEAPREHDTALRELLTR
ncbi:MAG: shikimate dehydrogenase family protein [Allosphingosinicella sp.]